MPSSSHALQQSVFAALVTDAPLLGLLGGPHVFDDVPQPAPYPHVTLGQTTVRDWSTGTEAGDEHILTLHVWSRAGGKREVQAISAALEAALHDRVLTLSGHRLVNLRREHAEARRDPDGDTMHGLVRFRAVTEPLA